jgi:sulfur-carrier protein
VRPAPGVEVDVRLFANLADYGPPGARGGAARVEMPDGATVRDLLHRLRVPDEVPRVLLVNGRDVDLAVELHPDDVVDVLPALAGG